MFVLVWGVYVRFLGGGVVFLGFLLFVWIGCLDRFLFLFVHYM